MKRKKYFLLLFWIMILFLNADTDHFDENVAQLSLHERTSITVPFLSYQINLKNSLLRLRDLKIFDTNKYENGQLMSGNDKKILTDNDLNFYTDLHFPVIKFSYQNWKFDLSVHGNAEINLLDKTYTKMVLYGNETNQEYETAAGSGSAGYAFSKVSFGYGLPEPVNLQMLIKNKKIQNPILDYILAMPIYAGANLNLYYPAFMAKVKNSYQQFGSFDDSLYYNVNMRYAYFDENSVGKLTPAFGFGLMTELPDGWFHFQLDDIFARLICEDLAGAEYQEDYSNQLLYFDEDYEPFHESYENDSLRVKRQQIHFHPSVLLGLEYRIYRHLYALANYNNVDYENRNGFSLGLATDRDLLIPVKFMLGLQEIPFYEFSSGIRTKNFEWLFTTTFHSGFFNYTKGLGFGTEINIHF